MKDRESGGAAGNAGCLRPVVGVGLGLTLGVLVGIVVGLAAGVAIALTLGVL